MCSSISSPTGICVPSSSDGTVPLGTEWFFGIHPGSGPWGTVCCYRPKSSKHFIQKSRMWAASFRLRVQRKVTSAAASPGMFPQTPWEGMEPVKGLIIDRHMQFSKHVTVKSEAIFPSLPLSYVGWDNLQWQAVPSTCHLVMTQQLPGKIVTMGPELP